MAGGPPNRSGNGSSGRSGAAVKPVKGAAMKMPLESAWIASAACVIVLFDPIEASPIIASYPGLLDGIAWTLLGLGGGAG